MRRIVNGHIRMLIVFKVFTKEQSGYFFDEGWHLYQNGLFNFISFHVKSFFSIRNRNRTFGIAVSREKW